MKKYVFLVCFSVLCLAARGVEYINTTHTFNTTGAVSWPDVGGGVRNYHIGTMTADGTVYTCSGTATFTDYANAGGICIMIPSTKEVVVSPTIARLSHFQVFHYPNLVSLQISVSTNNGSSWTVVPDGQLTKRTGSTEVTGLDGDYQIKFKSTSGTIYLKYIYYFTTPMPDCGCFPYVPE